jgi:asparagine synthase (glutamine-hydrolysing)
MCGFFGIVNHDKNILSLENNARKGISSLSHRGPDDSGFFKCPNAFLAHTRLSIIDLEHGHQPMFSSDGKKIIVFNGEVFNYKELKDRLKGLGRSFRSESDTEVVLVAYEHFGEKCLELFHGMFAFAIYDQENREIFAARDRFGIKPFYHSLYEGSFIFGSEAKAFYDSDLVPFEPKEKNFNEYLIFGHVAGEETLHKHIKELEAGHFLTLKNGMAKKTQYYQFSRENSELRFRKEEEIVDELTAVIRDSVNLWSTAEVEVGSFLSGGIDSSLIVALASETISSLALFSLFFPGSPSHDERNVVSETARSIKSKAHFIKLMNNDFLGVLEKIYCNSNEPIPANSISRFVLSRGVRKNSDLKVVLCGDGADELFGGYIRHKKISDEYKEKGDLSDLSFALNKVAFPRLRLFSDNIEIANPTRMNTASCLSSQKPLNKTLELDLKMYLAPYLHSLDRMGMMFGLELRPPFLEHSLTEYVAQLPEAYKIKGPWHKYILRKVAEKYLSRNLVWNPKKIPLAAPMMSQLMANGALANLYKDVITKNSKISSYYDVKGMLQLLGMHEAGNENDHSNTLFRILTLELWLNS